MMLSVFQLTWNPAVCNKLANESAKKFRYLK